MSIKNIEQIRGGIMSKKKKEFERIEDLMLDASLLEIGGNGLAGNGLSGNGLSGNGLSGNGLSGNGISGNGLSSNGYFFNDSFNFEFDPNDFILEEETEKTK